MASAQLSAVFFLQVFFILAVCRCVGILARRVGQPQVVGEMIAGVIMGPSLFGLLFPSWQQVIFPKDSLKILYVLAQFGAERGGGHVWNMERAQFTAALNER